MDPLIALRALTREGQVRHGKTRHEKNDRFRIDDRTQWVLGFDNREKLALFEKEAQRLAGEVAALDREVRELTDAEQVCVEMRQFKEDWKNQRRPA